MVAIDVAVAFLHPLAVIALACLWTLRILRNEYRPHLPDEDVSADELTEQDTTAGDAEGVQS